MTTAQGPRPYPYTIDNGRGERLTFRILEEDDGGTLIGENRVAPGAGPPMHVHHLQVEQFTVVQGRMGYRIAGHAPRYAVAGESVAFSPGEPHRFWNAGDADLVVEGRMNPALNGEFILRSIFESARAHGGRPGLFDAAYLLTRYRSEFALANIPGLVQRMAFPVLASIGQMFGLYRKYADAPEPALPEHARGS